ncbi:MAG: GNAT family N-acetyltransferase [Gammaproteobacteria bacterium]|nr:GNAT family N-acetyltransferase [Gammaproteobacteria bacterium]MCP5135553.1 GNAT family N-acetyltransferase [Gammaproteobacteria bacterium]
MPSTEPVAIAVTRWSDSAAELAEIRRRVFIDEQGVPEAMEWDGLDDQAVHVLATHQGRPVACGRLLADGHIGRMAVLPAWRGRGIGRAMLDTLLQVARQTQASRVFLNAQTSAVGFYEKAGFQCEGDEFMDAGIPHCQMIRSLS